MGNISGSRKDAANGKLTPCGPASLLRLPFFFAFYKGRSCVGSSLVFFFFPTFLVRLPHAKDRFLPTPPHHVFLVCLSTWLSLTNFRKYCYIYFIKNKGRGNNPGLTFPSDFQLVRSLFDTDHKFFRYLFHQSMNTSV